jgi:hypothetical protein
VLQHIGVSVDETIVVFLAIPIQVQVVSTKWEFSLAKYQKRIFDRALRHLFLW